MDVKPEVNSLSPKGVNREGIILSMLAWRVGDALTEMEFSRGNTYTINPEPECLPADKNASGVVKPEPAARVLPRPRNEPQTTKNKSSFIKVYGELLFSHFYQVCISKRLSFFILGVAILLLVVIAL